MSKSAGSKERKQRNDERLFFYVVTVMSLFFGTVFCTLLYALNHRDKAQESIYENLPDTQPVVIPPDHPRQLVNFSLTNQAGRAVTRSDLEGKILVVDFLYTSCSLTCPVVNGCMEQIQRLTTNQPDVKLVSLTVDPRDDTVEALAKYGERFGADTNRWLMLTGDKATLYDLIGNSFLAQGPDDPFNYMPGNFVHTERIALVDSHGRLRGYFDGLNPGTATAVVAEINKLRN